MNTPAPLSKVIKVVAAIKRYDPVRNRTQVVDLINGVIGMMFRNPSIRQNYFRTEECALASHYQESCLFGSPSTFLGVVIPCGVSNIIELRTDNTAFDITEKRVPGCTTGALGLRNTMYGNLNIGDNRRCRPMAEHLRPRLLEKDIPCNSSRVVTFRSDSDEDCNMYVGARYIDLNGNEQKEDIPLSTTPMGTSMSVRSFLNLTFPERSGWVNVATAEGDYLGKYHPSIYVPNHEWFRLQAGCPGMPVSYRGLFTPFNAVFNTDLVPFSDDTIWKLAIQAFENLDAMELTSGQTAALNRIFAQLAAVSDEDLESKNHNYNDRLLPDTSKQMLSTARVLSRRT